MRHLIAPDVNSVPAQWAVLREKLNLDRAYLDMVMDASTDPRHGKRAHTTGDVQLEVTHRAWTVMDRFIAFLRRGGADALPLSEFPMLT